MRREIEMDEEIKRAFDKQTCDKLPNENFKSYIERKKRSVFSKRQWYKVTKKNTIRKLLETRNESSSLNVPAMLCVINALDNKPKEGSKSNTKQKHELFFPKEHEISEEENALRRQFDSHSRSLKLSEIGALMDSSLPPDVDSDTINKAKDKHFRIIHDFSTRRRDEMIRTALQEGRYVSYITYGKDRERQCDEKVAEIHDEIQILNKTNCMPDTESTAGINLQLRLFTINILVLRRRLDDAKGPFSTFRKDDVPKFVQVSEIQEEFSNKSYVSDKQLIALDESNSENYDFVNSPSVYDEQNPLNSISTDRKINEKVVPNMNTIMKKEIGSPSEFTNEDTILEDIEKLFNGYPEDKMKEKNDTPAEDRDEEIIILEDVGKLFNAYNKNIYTEETDRSSENTEEIFLDDIIKLYNGYEEENEDNNYSLTENPGEETIVDDVHNCYREEINQAQIDHSSNCGETILEETEEVFYDCIEENSKKIHNSSEGEDEELAILGDLGKLFNDHLVNKNEGYCNSSPEVTENKIDNGVDETVNEAPEIVNDLSNLDAERYRAMVTMYGYEMAALRMFHGDRYSREKFVDTWRILTMCNDVSQTIDKQFPKHRIVGDSKKKSPATEKFVYATVKLKPRRVHHQLPNDLNTAFKILRLQVQQLNFSKPINKFLSGRDTYRKTILTSLPKHFESIESRLPMNYSELIESDYKFNVLIGEPGSGKSTLLSYLDTLRTYHEFSFSDSLTDFGFVIMYDCADRSKKTFSDIVYSNYQEGCRAIRKRRVIHQISHLRTLYLVDGFDEIHDENLSTFHDFLETVKRYPGNVIISTRPEAVERLYKELASVANVANVYSIAHPGLATTSDDPQEFPYRQPAQTTIRPLQQESLANTKDTKQENRDNTRAKTKEGRANAKTKKQESRGNITRTKKIEKTSVTKPKSGGNSSKLLEVIKDAIATDFQVVLLQRK